MHIWLLLCDVYCAYIHIYFIKWSCCWWLHWMHQYSCAVNAPFFFARDAKRTRCAKLLCVCVCAVHEIVRSCAYQISKWYEMHIGNTFYEKGRHFLLRFWRWCRRRRMPPWRKVSLHSTHNINMQTCCGNCDGVTYARARSLTVGASHRWPQTSLISIFFGSQPRRQWGRERDKEREKRHDLLEIKSDTCAASCG